MNETDMEKAFKAFFPTFPSEARLLELCDGDRVMADVLSGIMSTTYMFKRFYPETKGWNQAPELIFLRDQIGYSEIDIQRSVNVLCKRRLLQRKTTGRKQLFRADFSKICA